jgi:hypothetical protein
MHPLVFLEATINGSKYIRGCRLFKEARRSFKYAFFMKLLACSIRNFTGRGWCGEDSREASGGWFDGNFFYLPESLAEVNAGKRIKRTLRNNREPN